MIETSEGGPRESDYASVRYTFRGEEHTGTFATYKYVKHDFFDPRSTSLPGPGTPLEVLVRASHPSEPLGLTQVVLVALHPVLWLLVLFFTLRRVRREIHDPRRL